MGVQVNRLRPSQTWLNGIGEMIPIGISYRLGMYTIYVNLPYLPFEKTRQYFLFCWLNLSGCARQTTTNLCCS